ncbi:hypothetical protein ACFE04_025200 [Oxalis oulophora]
MTTATATASTTNQDYIKTQCSSTLYNSLCNRTFYGYANKISRSHDKLTRTALSLTLTQANSTETYISTLKKQSAVNDCKSLIKDSASRLNDSIKELAKMKSATTKLDFAWHKSNVQTWVSAAYTDSDTCLDEVKASSGGGDQKLKDSIAYLQKLTSISLTFINSYNF